MRERYWVRWRATPRTDGNAGLMLVGWDVCDDNEFDNITVRSFGVHEKEQAEGLCKLLNSIEEENHGLSK